MIVLLFLFTLNAWGYEHIAQHITSNNPNLSEGYTIRVAKAISKYSTKYGIDPIIYSAILMQESSYRMGVHNCSLVRQDRSLKLRVCNDYSISMININTIKLYGFDKQRLIKDLDYAIKCGAIVLRDLNKMYRHEPDYWVRYNVGTRPKHLIPTIWNRYKQAVTRWL